MTTITSHALLFVLGMVALSGPVSAQEPAGPSPYVVAVDYAADAANFEALKTQIEGVARASIAEPGCRRFDVMVPASTPGHILLWEVFDDAAAFQAHAATSHFKAFAASSAKLGASRVATPGAFLVSLQKP